MPEEAAPRGDADAVRRVRVFAQADGVVLFGTDVNYIKQRALTPQAGEGKCGAGTM